ncbi:MAG: amidohydrolase [Armatimonadetes bacterium]|nr:amidohydrolase [Armatimonadota bacterium]
MIIDAHNHPDWHGHDLKRFIENMDRCRVDKTWLLSWECPADEFDPSYWRVLPSMIDFGSPIPFSRCVSYMERASDRFILGYAPDPRRPEAIAMLESAISLYDVRVCGELKLRMMYDNPDAVRMFRFCGEKGLPVIVHIDYELETKLKYPRSSYWYGGGIEALERAIQLCPETQFLGHAPGFWSHISGDDQYKKAAYPTGKVLPGSKVVDMLCRYPNLYCDVSAGSGHNALARDPDFAKQFLLEFQDRILYGRDNFDNVHQEFINSLGLPEEVLSKIYSENALKLVPLHSF